MKNKVFILFLVLASTLFLSGCQGNNTESALLSKSELSNCELFVHNVTTSEIFEVRTVPNTTFRDDVILLSVEVEAFRPIISSDIILGSYPDAYFILKSETEKYTFSFFDTKKQLSLDYIHRDSPMLSVGKDEIDENGNPHNIWGWFCSMSAADYAKLYEMIQTYTEGEVVK